MEAYFSIGALSVGSVLKGVEYFFEGYDGFGLFINCFPHYPVGTFS
jgi:hypothetical protein